VYSQHPTGHLRWSLLSSKERAHSWKGFLLQVKMIGPKMGERTLWLMRVETARMPTTERTMGVRTRNETVGEVCQRRLLRLVVSTD